MRDNLLIKSLKFVFTELKESKNNLYSLAKENVHQQTLRTSLGIGWVFIRDTIYLVAFIIFRFLMAGSDTIEGMNFILFIMIGMIPWNLMNECINGGVKAIKNNRAIISSIKFPITILPTIEIIAIFLKRSFTFVILFGVILVFGDVRNVTWWLFIYYSLAMLIFMIFWNLFFSSLITISNDFEQLYTSITSILFFLVPVIWSFETIKDFPTIIRIFKLNPFVYILEGFRDACYSGTFPDLEYTIYFWCVGIVLLFTGSVLQYKLKSHYIDLI